MTQLTELLKIKLEETAAIKMVLRKSPELDADGIYAVVLSDMTTDIERLLANMEWVELYGPEYDGAPINVRMPGKMPGPVSKRDDWPFG